MLFSCSVMSDSLWPHGLQQASLSFTISQSLLRIMSIESVMPSNYLIFCCSLLALSLSQRQSLFWWVSSSHQVAKVLALWTISLGCIFKLPGHGSPPLEGDASWGAILCMFKRKGFQEGTKTGANALGEDVLWFDVLRLKNCKRYMWLGCGRKGER